MWEGCCWSRSRMGPDRGAQGEMVRITRLSGWGGGEVAACWGGVEATGFAAWSDRRPGGGGNTSRMRRGLGLSKWEARVAIWSQETPGGVNLRGRSGLCAWIQPWIRISSLKLSLITWCLQSGATHNPSSAPGYVAGRNSQGSVTFHYPQFTHTTSPHPGPAWTHLPKGLIYAENTF